MDFTYKCIYRQKPHTVDMLVFPSYSSDQLYGIIEEHCKIEGCEYFSQKLMEFMDAIKLINTKKVQKNLLDKIPAKCRLILTAIYNFVDMSNNMTLDLEIVIFT